MSRDLRYAPGIGAVEHMADGSVEPVRYDAHCGKIVAKYQGGPPDMPMEGTPCEPEKYGVAMGSAGDERFSSRNSFADASLIKQCVDAVLQTDLMRWLQTQMEGERGANTILRQDEGPRLPPPDAGDRRQIGGGDMGSAGVPVKKYEPNLAPNPVAPPLHLEKSGPSEHYRRARRSFDDIGPQTAGSASRYRKRQVAHEELVAQHDAFTQGTGKANAERISRYCQQHGCDYETGRSALGLETPPPLPPSQ